MLVTAAGRRSNFISLSKRLTVRAVLIAEADGCAVEVSIFIKYKYFSNLYYFQKDGLCVLFIAEAEGSQSIHIYKKTNIFQNKYIINVPVIERSALLPFGHCH